MPGAARCAVFSAGRPSFVPSLSLAGTRACGVGRAQRTLVHSLSVARLRRARRSGAARACVMADQEKQCVVVVPLVLRARVRAGKAHLQSRDRPGQPRSPN
jgi:hypothetical protein